jgi:acyl phosphate:glycerol-3-phosphate acyltransferase
MANIECILASAVIGYLLGSINTTILVGRLYGKDVTQLGSKSAGLTNALRVLGKAAASLVLVGDVLKGVLACLTGMYFGGDQPSLAGSEALSLYAAGAGVVIGHNWPIYFGFKGGKGALTAAAVMFTVNWQLASISLGLFVLIIAATRYVSLGTICASIFFSILSFMPFFGMSLYFKLFALLLAAIIVLKHSANIQRLLSGTENKLSF